MGPPEVTAHLREQMAARGGVARQRWQEKLVAYQRRFEKESRQLRHIMEGTLPEGWDANLKPFETDAKGIATRVSSGKCLNMVASLLPWMMGGSADLSNSCNTELKFEQAGD